VIDSGNTTIKARQAPIVRENFVDFFAAKYEYNENITHKTIIDSIISNNLNPKILLSGIISLDKF
jgi:hypothetical protein